MSAFLNIFRTVLLITACLGCSYAQSPDESVKKVHVVFKTHLDIGFTNLSSEVTRLYIDKFIPKAIETAEELRKSGGKERYVWTTGSWLVRTFMEQATPEEIKRLEEAIKRGDIVWNGLPYTIESEVANKELFEAFLNLSKDLDRRFGKKTTAAKLTDVPGHTRGIVPLLSKAGISFLHIGVNPASKVPGVPPICRWQDPSGSEIILMYQKDYGSAMVLPDGETAISIAFTGDNHGPHSVEEVKGIYAGLQKRFPNAEIMASNLNNIAAELEKSKSSLPVVTNEIGDTWIHGMGSSPIRMARFRAMQRLYAKWIEEKRLDPNSGEAIDFAVTLGLIAEHTWGVDVKTHLKNWDKYDVDVFRQSRELPEFKMAEASWKELDANVDKAVEFLPPNLQAEAKKELAGIGNPVSRSIKGENIPGHITKQGAFQINHKDFKMTAGILAYQSFSKEDFDAFQKAYLTRRVGWAIADFGKPGLEKSKAQSATIEATVQNCDHTVEGKQQKTDCSLSFPKDSRVDSRILPEETYVNYSFDPDKNAVHVNVTINKKPANRLPEAYWFSFMPEQVKNIFVEKTGEMIDVLDVVEGGNRQLHGMDRYVEIVTSTGRIRITSLDALLVAVGERNLLNHSTKQPDIGKGVHFCLFNNVWGTNFSMWFEGSITYRFCITFHPQGK